MHAFHVEHFWNWNKSYRQYLFLMSCFSPNTHTHRQTHKHYSNWWCLLELKKYNSIIIASVYVGGGEKNHFRKNRDFIWIVMNPCGQEWASGRLETQIWKSTEVLLSVWLSIDLCTCERPGKESPENSTLRAHNRLGRINMTSIEKRRLHTANGHQLEPPEGHHFSRSVKLPL